MKRDDILNEKDQIIKMISSGMSKQNICSYLNCKNNTLNKYLKLMGIEYSGKRKYEPKKRIEYYLRKNITISNTHHFKKRLIKEGIKNHVCEKCNRTEWEGNPIPIELYHIDGNRSNNLLSNLEILCPNCHTLTGNYKSKNVNKDKNYSILNIIDDSENFTINNIKKVKNKKVKVANNYNHCECGNVIKKKSKRCKECDSINQQKVKRPSYEQLIKDLNESNYSAVGRKYGVSDNSIRKWIRIYEKI